MNDGTNAMIESEPKDSQSVSFAGATRFLGVDLFTFYSMAQREEIPTVLTTWGEFAVTQETLNSLAAAKGSSPMLKRDGKPIPYTHPVPGFPKGWTMRRLPLTRPPLPRPTEASEAIDQCNFDARYRGRV